MILRIGKINYFGDKVSPLNLVEVLSCKLNGNGIVCEIRFGTCRGRPNLEGGVVLFTRATGTIGQLQAINGAWREVFARWHDERF